MGHRSQTHCANGHLFTPENTYWAKRKARPERGRAEYFSRRCKTCHLESAKLYHVYKYKGGSHAARKAQKD